jgi:hypothetical protein
VWPGREGGRAFLLSPIWFVELIFESAISRVNPRATQSRYPRIRKTAENWLFSAVSVILVFDSDH